jgi:hypothetical protein
VGYDRIGSGGSGNRLTKNKKTGAKEKGQCDFVGSVYLEMLRWGSVAVAESGNQLTEIRTGGSSSCSMLSLNDVVRVEEQY